MSEEARAEAAQESAEQLAEAAAGAEQPAEPDVAGAPENAQYPALQLPEAHLPEEKTRSDALPDESSAAEAPPAEPGATQVRPARGRQTVADMVRSMALVVGVVVVAVFATVSLGRDPVLDLDYTSDLTAARIGAPYDIYAPVGLDGWRTTSVRFGPVEGATVWHLGLVAPSEEYVGLDQTDGDAAPFIANLTEDAADTGSSVTIGAEQWTRYDGGGNDDGETLRGLARDDGGTTVLVSGTAGWNELEEFASALRAD